MSSHAQMTMWNDPVKTLMLRLGSS